MDANNDHNDDDARQRGLKSGALRSLANRYDETANREDAAAIINTNEEARVLAKFIIKFLVDDFV